MIDTVHTELQVLKCVNVFQINTPAGCGTLSAIRNMVRLSMIKKRIGEF
jgi:hypothetical protein